MDKDTSTEIYLGTRDTEFKEFIKALLVRGRLVPKYIDLLTNEENIIEYEKAFTALSADEFNNSEMYEQVGDMIANTFIVNYMYKRFPQLRCAQGVKIVARLRINYGAKQSFYKIAEDLGFWKYISASDDERNRRKKPLLEDALEAFLGCTQYILDNMFRPGVGYGVVNDILTSIFDKMDISLEYNNLYDAKTRLKELFDHYKGRIGTLEYTEEKVDRIVVSTVVRIIDNKKIPIGKGSASLKVDAQQNAATQAIDVLNKLGFVKELPEVYKHFCGK